MLLAYVLFKETIYYNVALQKHEPLVCPLDGDTKFFYIVTRVLLGDSLAPYLYIIC